MTLRGPQISWVMGHVVYSIEDVVCEPKNGPLYWSSINFDCKEDFVSINVVSK